MLNYAAAVVLLAAARRNCFECRRRCGAASCAPLTTKRPGSVAMIYFQRFRRGSLRESIYFMPFLGSFRFFFFPVLGIMFGEPVIAIDYRCDDAKKKKNSQSWGDIFVSGRT
jgi:hypothetical protein